MIKLALNITICHFFLIYSVEQESPSNCTKPIIFYCTVLEN